jgi:formylglycine-generating enzyme required for sulfatase activity
LLFNIFRNQIVKFFQEKQSFIFVFLACLQFSLWPAGKFQYDGNAADICTISSAFHMSEYDITGAQFAAVTGLSDPSYFPAVTQHPVEAVSWYAAIVFCNDLSIKEGLTPAYTISGSTTPSVWITAAGGSIPTTDNPTWDAVTADWNASGYRLPTEMEYMWAAMGAYSDSRPGDIVGGINTGGYNKSFEILCG